MAFDYRRIRFGEMIAAVSGILLFLFMFIDWYGYSATGGFGAAGGSKGIDAWQSFSFVDILLFIVAFAAILPAVLSATQRTVALPVAASAVVTALGVLGVLLILFRIVLKGGPDIPELLSPSIHETLRIGIFLGLIAAAGVAFGGYQSMRSEGTTFDVAKAQARSAVSGGGTGGRTTVPPASRTPPAAPPAAPPTTPPAPPPPPGRGEPPVR